MTSAALCASSVIVKWRRQCLLLTLQLGSQTLCKLLDADHLVYDEAFPIIKRKVRQSKCKPWITKGIKNSIKTKHKLYKKYVYKPTKSNEIHYKKYKNKLTVIIRLSHKSHYQNELNKNRSNLKNAWQIFNKKI